MPKTGIFDDTILFSSFLEMREKITALQYLRGDRDFAETARNLLYGAVDKEIESMDPVTRRRFEQIRENAKAQTVIRKQKKAERKSSSGLDSTGTL